MADLFDEDMALTPLYELRPGADDPLVLVLSPTTAPRSLTHPCAFADCGDPTCHLCELARIPTSSAASKL